LTEICTLYKLNSTSGRLTLNLYIESQSKHNLFMHKSATRFGYILSSSG